MVRKKNTLIGSRRVISRAVAMIYFTAGQAIAWKHCGSRRREIFHRSSKFQRGIGRAKDQKSEVRGQKSEKTGSRGYYSSGKDFWKSTNLRRWSLFFPKKRLSL